MNFGLSIREGHLRTTYGVTALVALLLAGVKAEAAPSKRKTTIFVNMAMVEVFQCK